jgi:preprotein translocase subunit SecG
MTVTPPLAVGIVMNIVAVLFVLVCFVLVLVILIQKGRGGGLSGAFGGGMASGLLGSKTGDFLTWVTIVVVGVFLVLAVLLAKFYRPAVSQYGVPAAQTQTPATAPAPTGPPQPPGATLPVTPAPQQQPAAPAAAPTGPASEQTPGPAPAPEPATNAAGG